MGDKGQDSRSPLSKSRSKSKREFVSRNPFVNFLQNFRRLPENQNTPTATIFKLAGERWRNMNEMEKAPYVSAANEVKSKEPRIKNPKGKKKGEARNTTKVTADKNKKKIKKRKCSKCGHRHGSPSSRGESTDSFDKEALDDDDLDDDKTTVRSRSRSASRSGSRSGSGSTNGESNYWSDSDTTA